MPQYPFACSECGAEFDVERSEDDLKRLVACPMDGSISRRVYGVTPADGARRARAIPYGAFWHDHGPGTEPHMHGPGLPTHH
jgi:putative FmdB family regulatory protein